MLQVKIEFDREAKLAATVVQGEGWTSTSRADGFVIIEHPDRGNVIVTNTVGNKGGGWMTMVLQPMNRQPKVIQGVMSADQTASAIGTLEYLTDWVNAYLTDWVNDLYPTRPHHEGRVA